MKTKKTRAQLPVILLAQAQELGKLVRGARIKRQWTQKDLAERAAISITTLQRFERGESVISFAAVLMICWLLDIPWKVDIDPGQLEYLKALTEDRKRARMTLEDRLDDNF